MSDWNEADQHAQRAQKFYRAGQWERALAELREALDQRPDEGEWWFGLGLTLDALERYEEAADAFEKALRRRGEDVPGLLHLGIDLIRAGQPEAAIETLARVNQLDASVELGYVHRILAHTLLEEHDQAELMFYLARQFALPDEPVNLYEATPDDSEAPDGQVLPRTQDQTSLHDRDQTQAMAFDYLGQSLVLRQDYDRAVWCWHETLNLDPSHPEANRSLAVLHQQRGQLERARLYFQRQLRITPHDVETLLDFADLLMRQNRLSEAGDKYRRALECDGTLAVAHERLGQLALINGHLNAASDRFERARQLDPTLPGVHLGLATAAHQRDDDERARQWLLEELELEGQTAEQALEVAGLLVDLELHHEAIRLLNPLLSGADDLLMNDDALYAAALLCRGVASIAEGELDEGIADCHRCLKLTPDSVAAMSQLAGAYFQLGDLDEAQSWARAGLDVGPDDLNLRKLDRRIRRAQLVYRARRILRRE
ncbi:MAG: tetratricopeptide repeat protein [Planctomycetota bacterium]